LYGFFQKNILFSIIPIGEDNSIADSLGIKKEEEACNILLARRVKKIDIGFVNNYYFLNKATIESQNSIIDINGEYIIESKEKGTINIFNLKSSANDERGIKVNPIDGKLDVYIKNRGKDLSFLSVNKLKISNPHHSLILDDIIEIKTPAEINVIAGKLNVVVGKDRSFE
jgi:hypothetical protein